jgi:hypothetical protein
MRRYVVSALAEPPFPARLHPAAARAGTETAQWATDVGIARTPADRLRLDRADAGGLAGRACPGGAFDDLRLLTDLCTWLFAFDDACDEDGLGDDPVRLAPVVARLLGVLDLGGSGPASPVTAGPAGAGLHDLCRRIRTRDRSGLMSRFVGQFRGYLLALLWEATNRQRRRVPGVEEYVQLRRHTGGVHPCFTLTELTRGAAPVGGRYDPTLAGLDNLAADLVCWCNDVFSYDKEHRGSRDGLNLVTAVARESGRPGRAALPVAVGWFNAGLARYGRLEAEVLTGGDRTVEQFVDVRRCWIRATWDWSTSAARYR